MLSGHQIVNSIQQFLVKHQKSSQPPQRLTDVAIVRNENEYSMLL